MQRINIVVCGPTAGKRSLMERFASGKFKEKLLKTLGLHLYSREITFTPPDVEQEVTTKVFLFYIDDSSVSEESYLREEVANGVLFVFDITESESLVELQEWVDRVNSRLLASTPRVLVSTKHDLSDQHKISYEAIQEFSQKNNITYYYHTSSKTGFNVDKPFFKLAGMIYSEKKSD